MPVTEINHRASEPAGGSTAAGGSPFLYTNKFTCIPFEVPYRPAFITPKPMIPGVQTAIVVGPAGEQIHTDEYGRVKVQFPWDRGRQFNQDSSCWIRVSQTQAGTGWGAMFLPRIGQEAIVDFLEGDPDRPIITGCVYNGLNTQPYSLPAEKTKSTIKTISVPDNGKTNEIRFEDAADEEQLFIQAAKTFDIRVNDKSREYVGETRHLIVTENQLEKVDGDKHLKVAGDHKEKVSENAPKIVLQSHLDMVCEKRAGSDHDFSEDPIKLIYTDKWLYADNTTLARTMGLGLPFQLHWQKTKRLPIQSWNCFSRFARKLD